MRRIDRAVDALRVRDKEADDLKVRDEVFDEPTLKALYGLSSKGTIQALGGVISTGKEANVFHALGPHDAELAVKIYRIKTSDFKTMQDYILGDYRFAHVRRTKRDMVFAWTKKEFRNLVRACKADVRVPKPIQYRENVLVMEFMGKNGVPFPLLKLAIKHTQNISGLYQMIIDSMQKLYRNARLVHADLSEYNILLNNDATPIFIDMGQSVLIDHPRATEFLRRDISNILSFFRSVSGLEVSETEVLRKITQ